MNVLIKGFKNKEHALEFVRWYEGGGEQNFYDHLDIVGVDSVCNVNVSHKGNTGRYWDETDEQISITLK
jgi:hypothetical protein